MNGFLDDIYLRPACYDCAFKSIPKHYADITIADFWGVTRNYPQLHDGMGTSLVLLHNRRGDAFFNQVKDGFHYEVCDFKKAISRNKTLTHSAALRARRKSFFDDYAKFPFETVAKRHMTAFKWASHKVIAIACALIRQKLGRGGK